MWENTTDYYGRDLLWVSCSRCGTWRVIPPYYGSYDVASDTQFIDGARIDPKWECESATWCVRVFFFCLYSMSQFFAFLLI